MGNLKAFIEEHRKGAAIAFILLLLFVSGSAISAFRVAQDRAQEAAQAEGSAQGQDPEGNNAPQEDVELTESQREAIAGYDDDTRAFIETLSASVWSAGNGRYTLRFSDDSYVETVDGEAVTHSYAIERIDRESDGYGGTIATIVFESDTGVHVATYTDGKGAAVQPGSGGGQADSTVIASLTSASMFAAKDTPYERAEAVEAIAVRGLNSEVMQLLGDDADALADEMSRWCAVHYPTATEAVWDGSAFVDWDGSLVSTDFTLNDDAATVLTVVFHTDSGAFEFDG